MRTQLNSVFLVLNIILMISKIECQVVLTRELLEKWYGDDLTSLPSLNLVNREIASIDPETFNGLTNLVHLYLFLNKLSSIDRRTFNGLGNLQGLFFSDNRLTSIAPYTFNSLKSLVVLDLDNNQIISVPVNIFLGLTNLREVRLYGNPVHDLNGLPYLQSLCDPNPNCIVY